MRISKKDNSNKRILRVIFNLWLIMPKYLKYDFILIIFGSLVCALLEIISISSIIPIINSLQDPRLVNHYNNQLNVFFRIKIEDQNFITLFFVLFILIILFSTLSRIMLLRNINKFSAKSGIFLGNKLLEYYIFLEYKVIKNLKASELIANLTIYLNNVVGSINQISNISTSIIIVSLIILSLIFYTGPGVIFLFIAVIILYFISRYALKKRISDNSKIEFKFSQNNVRILNHIIRNYREVFLENSQNFYLNQFKKSLKRQKFAMVENQFYSLVPKYFIEGFSLITFSILTLFFFFSKSNFNSLTLVGLTALSLQKLLPLINQIFQSWAGINSHIDPIEKVIFNIKQNIYLKNNSNKNIYSINKRKKNKFQSLELRNITYEEKNLRKIFSNFNLKINQGEKVAIIGRSGSGKTTLVEIIMGLIKPQKGEYYLNERIINSDQNHILQKNFSCVYQNMFIGEETIKKGIIAEEDKFEFNAKKYKKAISISEVEPIINEAMKGDLTDIGEYGSKISGGQMQRIAIARAIYRDKNILIFDEATNALDKILEEKILKNISENLKDKTIIFVTHNISLLKYCDKIVDLSNL